MLANSAGRGPDGRIKDVIGLYARRRARMIFLRMHAPDGHPVLKAEEYLVEMARSKLAESLLSGEGRAHWHDAEARSRTEEAMRSEMRRSASSLTSDPETVERMNAEIGLQGLDSVLPTGAGS